MEPHADPGNPERDGRGNLDLARSSDTYHFSVIAFL
jgi:hypothetical protein